MRTFALALLAVLLLASAGRADLSEMIDAAQGALEDQIADLGTIPDPTKAQKKEGKLLQKALGKLDDYTGSEDSSDLKCCYKAAKLIIKSKTGDEDVWGALESVKDALDSLADEIRAEAVALLPTVREEKKGKVEKLIAKGDAARDVAYDLWPADAKKCLKLLLKAIATFRKAVEKATKYQDEPPEPPNDVFIYATRLFNNSAEEVQITDITYGVSGTLGGAPYSFGGKASETHPGLVPIPIPTQDSYDFLPVLTALVNSDPLRPQWIPGDVIKVTYTLHTTAGDFSSP